MLEILVFWFFVTVLTLIFLAAPLWLISVVGGTYAKYIVDKWNPVISNQRAFQRVTTILLYPYVKLFRAVGLKVVDCNHPAFALLVFPSIMTIIISLIHSFDRVTVKVYTSDVASLHTSPGLIKPTDWTYEKLNGIEILGVDSYTDVIIHLISTFAMWLTQIAFWPVIALFIFGVLHLIIVRSMDTVRAVKNKLDKLGDV